jgi:hypothetical protein
MTPRERAELVFSEHEFAWREGERGHHIALVEKAISGVAEGSEHKANCPRMPSY